RPVRSGLVPDQDHRRVLRLVRDIGSQRLKQLLYFGPAARNEGPSGSRVEPGGKLLQALGHISDRVHADRNQLHVPAGAVTQFLLYLSERGRERWAYRRASRKDEVDDDGPAFHEVGIESKFVLILIIDRDIGGPE